MAKGRGTAGQVVHHLRVDARILGELHARGLVELAHVGIANQAAQSRGRLGRLALAR